MLVVLLLIDKKGDKLEEFCKFYRDCSFYDLLSVEGRCLSYREAFLQNMSYEHEMNEYKTVYLYPLKI